MSLNTQPSNSIIERLRGLFQRRVKDSIFAVLGDSDSPGARVDVPGRIGYVYVRFPGGRDANGFTNFSTPMMARSAGAAFPNVPGFGVYVAYGDNGELEIKSAHYQSLDNAGINTSVLNPLNQQSTFVYLWQLTMGLALSVATSATSSTLVMVKSFRYYVGNTFGVFETPFEADKPDLDPYIPSAGNHCYAGLWIDTYTNLPVVTTSIPQAITTPLDATDLQELIVRVASSRPADGVPLKAFYLANGQTTIKQSVDDVDIRQMLDNPHTWGFPNVLTTLERVWPNMTLITGPYTTSGVGAVTVEAGGQIIIVHQNNFIATTTPTVGDDSGDGYSIGSLWFNRSTGVFYVAEDVTLGAAVWTAVNGAGGAGITQLTGDVLAGPGSGSVAATLKVGVTIVSPVINTSISGSAISDDATFASPSSTIVPTTNAVKSYVDAVASGLSPKQSVLLATAAALPSSTYSNGVSGVGATLTGVATGVLTVDGTAVSLNDRLLIKNQAAGLQNGIYRCTVAGAVGVAFILTRTTDNDTSAEIVGSYVFVESGTVNSSAGFVNTNTGTVTIGTTALNWTQFSGAGEINVTAPIVKTGNNISLTTPLAITYGGTGQTTKTDAFDALSPTTTKGDIIVYDGSDNARLAAAANGRGLYTDSSTSTGLKYDYTEIETDGTAAVSGLTNGKIVYQSEVTGLWDLASTSAIGRLKGVIVDQGSSLINTAIRVRVMGQYPLSFGYGPVYVSSTPGVGTSTEPTPTFQSSGAAAPIIIAQIGYGEDGGLMINGFMNAIYRTWYALGVSAGINITHEINRPSYSRIVNIRNVVYATATAETYASSNQDYSQFLRGPSGAGSTNTIDNVGVGTFALGDQAGTDFRVSQSFVVTAAGTLSSLLVRAGATTGTPSGLPNWSIQPDNAGVPSGTPLATGGTANGTMASWTASADNTITVTNGVFLNTSTTYWFVLEFGAMQATNNFFTVIRNAGNPYANGLMKADSTTGASFPGTWTALAAGSDMRCVVTTSALVTTDKLAQGVSHSSDITVTSARLWLKNTGILATGTLTLAIFSDSGGSPNAVIANGTAATVDNVVVGSGYAYADFTFPITRPILTASTQYHLVLSTSSSASNTQYIEWGTDNTSPSYANGQMKTSISSAWAATSPASDGCFELLAQTTPRQELVSPTISGFSTLGSCIISYGDGAGASTDTITRITNQTGSGRELMIDIVIPSN